MDDKKQEFTPTVAPIKISSPFINKTEGTGNIVKFDEEYNSDGDECELYEDFKELVNGYTKLAERFISKGRTVLIDI